MPRYVLSAAAERDIDSILSWTHQHFGPQARLRYEALLVRAIVDVAEKPNRAGSHYRPEITADVRTYHLAHSRDRVAAVAGRVKHPRHCLLYRVRSDGRIKISRVFHDSMDLDRYRPAVPGDPPKL